MKKLILSALAVFIVSCNTDKDTDIEDIINNAPEITTQELQIDEHSISGTSVGRIEFSDKDNTDTLTITTDSDVFDINETTGEVTVGANAALDFEATPTINFTVSVFDGTTITEQNILLILNNINEYNALSVEQKEFTDYFRFLALWEDSNNLNTIQKWGAPMTIFLDGTITTDYRATVQSILDEYNALFNLGNFSISLVDNLADSNTHLYFGSTAEIEPLWSDMFAIIDGKTYDGYAMTSSNNFMLNDSRIWISSDTPSLFKHELGHALGLGHSNKCDSEKSFMCSTISPENDFLDAEKEIIRLLYHEEMTPGTTAEELNNVVANLILLN